MFSARIWLRALVIIAPLFLVSSAHAFVVDDDVPDVTGRVARISYADGDVQIRRAGATDWEKAVANLPVVEGDEIATSAFAKLEIEFDTRTFLRIGERSLFTVTTLRDEGIALSVPQGTVSVHVTDFDKDRSYLEIDFPRSTIAIQKSGSYRIDSGDRDSATARVRVTDDGEARIYSDTSGFTLRSDRGATIYLSGPYEGDWDTADAAQFADSFDGWTLDRDKSIAKQLNDSYFDKYYDRDIYGAEDLSGYGDWVYTNNYGYVWRPYRSAISSYSDWSPYRYGHWRWVPPYGWTWINDEPWGWATYHYGRWVYDSGSWFWTPYGYYRNRRSWWQPALVVINIFNNNVCWYPLGYYNRYHNYSRGGGGGWERRGGGGNNPGPLATPTPSNIPSQLAIREDRRRAMHTPTLLRMPSNSVVSTTLEDFGRGRGGIGRPSTEVAKTVLKNDPEDVRSVPVLPVYDQVKPKLSPEIIRQTPPIIAIENTTRVGAAERKTEKPLDEDLRRTRIFGNRPPVVKQDSAPAESRTSAPAAETKDEPRPTGAVNRPRSKQREETPIVQTPPIIGNRPTAEPQQKEQQKSETPVEPRYEPPRRVERQEAPRTEQPKYEPPPRREEPRREEPRTSSPPTQKREEPPPQKSEPKVEKPSPPSQPTVIKGKKDGE
jgi:hypothetical protein